MKKTYRKWEIQSSSQNLLCANVLASTFQKKTEDNFPAVTNARVLVSFLLWLVEHVKNRSRNSYRKPRMSQGNSTSTAAWNGFHITIFIFLTDFSSKIPFFTTDASHHANSRVFNFIKKAFLIMPKCIDVLVIWYLRYFFKSPKYWSIDKSIHIMGVLIICIEILLKCIV